MNIKALMEEEPEMQVALRESTKEFLRLPESHQEIVLTAAIEYETMNQQEKLIKARRDKQLRPIIEGAADAYGVEDDNENLHLVLGNTEILRMKKVSRTLNSVAAESLLKEKGLYEACVMQVISWELDEEKIVEAYEAGKISASELDNLFFENVSWATKVNTDVEEVKLIEKMRKEIEKSKPKELPTVECS